MGRHDLTSLAIWHLQGTDDTFLCATWHLSCGVQTICHVLPIVIWATQMIALFCSWCLCRSFRRRGLRKRVEEEAESKGGRHHLERDRTSSSRNAGRGRTRDTYRTCVANDMSNSSQLCARISSTSDAQQRAWESRARVTCGDGAAQSKSGAISGVAKRARERRRSRSCTVPPGGGQGRGGEHKHWRPAFSSCWLDRTKSYHMRAIRTPTPLLPCLRCKVSWSGTRDG